MKKIRHTITRITFALSVALAPGLVILSPVNADSSGTTELASVANDGSSPNSNSSESIISPDGRYVYFASNASNLVPNDTNNATDVFMRDRLTGTTTMLDVNSSGEEANEGVSIQPSFDISDGGRYLVFASASTNLVSSEYNQNEALFIRDLKANTTTLLYQNSFTGQGISGFAISGDGNWVAFATAQPLAPYYDTYGDSIYLINRKTHTLTRVSNGPNGTAPNGQSLYPDISYDGSTVVFASYATNLVSNDTNGKVDDFLWNRDSDNITRINVSSTGGQANADVTYGPSVSGDGNKVVFATNATNLVSQTTNFGNVYLRDVDAGTTTLISSTPTGQQGNGGSGDAVISEDGNYIIFESNASNLVSNDTDGSWSVFLKDLEEDSTTIENIDTSGDEVVTQGFLNVSSDGQYLTFAATLPAGPEVIYLRY